MFKVLVCFGTRPEVIKIASTLQELHQNHIPYKTVFTGQHDELFHDVEHLIPPPDYDLEIMTTNQSSSDILTRVGSQFPTILRKENPNLVMVQGDTSTVVAISLISFYEGFPVGHIEAGLRTYHPSSPFPEEVNRQIISRIAKIHWAPTPKAAENLSLEGVKNVFITGNTVIDMCRKYHFPVEYEKKVLVTLHRRENFGTNMISMFQQIESLAIVHPELEFIFPIHPNPEVQRHVGLFNHVKITSPMKYEELLKLLSIVKFVITDSGGIQEECAFFKKKVIVCREYTERPEGIEVGLSKLVGTDIKSNFHWANDHPEWYGTNPYGDGKAAERIVDSILTTLDR